MADICWLMASINRWHLCILAVAVDKRDADSMTSNCKYHSRALWWWLLEHMLYHNYNAATDV
jgi:hypothetical protein